VVEGKEFRFCSFSFQWSRATGLPQKKRHACEPRRNKMLQIGVEERPWDGSVVPDAESREYYQNLTCKRSAK